MRAADKARNHPRDWHCEFAATWRMCAGSPHTWTRFHGYREENREVEIRHTISVSIYR